MTKELATEFVSILEANMETIKSVLKENLNLDINLRIVVFGIRDSYVSLEEFECGESKKVLTSHPLLRQMFKDSQIDIRCWYFKEDGMASFTVRIFYEHAFTGGSNGLEIMGFDLNLETGEVTGLRK